jgi:hypothetical protein
MNIIYRNVQHAMVKQSFEEVLKKYRPLHAYEIILSQKRVKSSTMQAQPVFRIDSIINGIRAYRINLAVYVRDSQHIKVNDLPPEVLTGWFAHELGHVVDYAQKSGLQMVAFGFKYLTSHRFKKQVEHQADKYAIQYGFKKDILATKTYILSHNLIHEKYKKKMSRYYMPIEEVHLHPEDSDDLVWPKIEL